MSLLSDALAASRKILLVHEQLERLTSDTKHLASVVTDHEHRLIRIETTLDIMQRTSRRTLSWK